MVGQVLVLDAWSEDETASGHSNGFVFVKYHQVFGFRLYQYHLSFRFDFRLRRIQRK